MTDRRTSGSREGVDTTSARRVLGLIAEPGFAENVAHAVARQLPALLDRAAGGADSSEPGWKVEVVRHLLPLESGGELPLLSVGRAERHQRDWDVAVVLTELPRRVGKVPILADCAPDHGVGLVSMAAMGAVRVRRRTRELLVHLVCAHLSEEARRADRSPLSGAVRRAAIPSRYRTVDEREVNPSDEEHEAERAVDTNVDLNGAGLHFTLPGARGQARLLSGMVRANRPWRLVPSLAPALAGAMAGAAFGIFYSSIWQLADASSAARLALVNILAVLAMVAWLILNNNMWERSGNPRLRALSALYNAATLLTVVSGVAIMFLLLLTVAFVSACVIIPTSYLAHTLGHPAGPPDLATVAWLASCLGTVAGALGSGLADEEAVREAAYSRRERQRREWREAQAEQAEQQEQAAQEEQAAQQGEQEAAGQDRRTPGADTSASPGPP
ncbi:hypothetical protein [Streptomyces sp. 891-h]|uniref:hypothetical protein n=1 Tax=Streptomyces sp. 891-h TaxID=2720714 RepID=UPI001FAB1E4F|nr:hypothetical protein [Streptomyces sp. 891-h]